MNRQTLSMICAQVYRRFPEVAGSQPKMQARPDNQVLLVFRGSSKTSDGHSLSQAVRVVVSPDGKILKITTSR